MQETTQQEPDLTEQPAQTGESDAAEPVANEPNTPDEETPAAADAPDEAADLQPAQETAEKHPERVKPARKRVDMLNGPMWGKIVLFALPLAASGILQQLFNAADVAVVGRFANQHAQAAVGVNGPVINLLINLFIGLSAGANVVIANDIGRRRMNDVREAVHNAIPLALVGGVCLLLVGVSVARPIHHLIGTPDDVIEQAVAYLRIYFLGMPFIMLYNFGSAILRTVGDTKRPLICLCISGVLNVLLNLLLVIPIRLEAVGVAIATTVSNGVSATAVLFFLMRAEEPWLRLNPRAFRFQKRHLLRMVRIGLPAGIQGSLFSLANFCIQSAVNQFGAAGIAASALSANFEGVNYCVTNSFGHAAVTFVSQNYGARKFDRCRRAGLLSLFTAVSISICLSVLMVLLRGPLTHLFATDPETIRLATLRMEIVVTCGCLTALYEVTGGALRGLNYSVTPMLLTLFGTCLLRLVWIYTIFRAFPTFRNLVMVYPISWAITGIATVTTFLILQNRLLRTKAGADAPA